MSQQYVNKKLQKSFLLSALGFLTAACFSCVADLTEDLKGYFIRQDTFLYVYLNAEKVQISKIYASVDKYLIKDNYKGYCRLRRSAEKIGITEKDISGIYFSSSLKNVRATSDIKQESVYYLSGIVLKKDITTDKLLAIMRESLKNEPSVNICKIKQSNIEFIQIKTGPDSVYISVPQSKLVLTGSDLSNLVVLMDSYKTQKAKSSSSNMSKLLSQISSSASLYAVVALPPFMTKEFQLVNSKVKHEEQEDVRYKMNNAIKNLNGLTLETKTDDALTLKINTFFKTEEGAKSFNELANQFIPLLKFQLFMMVQNSTLPVLNTITAGVKNKSVSLSGILTSDDFVSINQMIKNNDKSAGF